MDQVLHECGITSTFIPGSEVPIWFEHRIKGSQITFCLPIPSDPDEKISCFNLCIAFSFVSDQIFEFQPSLFIFNETKEITRTYFSSFIGIPETNNNTMLWLIQWPAKGFMLEGGDSLSCTVAAFDLNIREFAVTYKSENNTRYESDFLHYYSGMSMIARDTIFYTNFSTRFFHLNDLICIVFLHIYLIITSFRKRRACDKKH